MTVANDSTVQVASSTAKLRPPLVAKKPPKFEIGQTVVLRGYEDGWRWTVESADLRGRRNPHWDYWVATFRPYDGKLVRCQWSEWKLRPAPEAAG